MRVLLALVVVAGCYSPSPDACTLSCDEAGQCPEGLTCGVDQFCHADGEDANCAFHTLTLRTAGPGTVTGPSISCAGTCTTSMKLADGPYQLMATPDLNARLTTWGNDCNAAEPCTIQLDRDLEIVANFDAARQLTMEIAGNGHGRLHGTTDDALFPSFDCIDAPCTVLLQPGTTVTLGKVDVLPARSSWTGDCAAFASTSDCLMIVDTDKAVGAQFSVTKLSLLVAPNSSGTISVDNANQCDASCEVELTPQPTPHVFEAVAKSAFVFSRWITLPTTNCDNQPVTNCAMTVVDGSVVIALFDPLVVTIDLRNEPAGTVTYSVFGLTTPVTCLSGELCTTPPIPKSSLVILDSGTAIGNPTTTLDHWSTCPDSTDETASSCTFVMGTTDVLVTPTFQ